MSWNIKLTSNKMITKGEVKNVIDDLPACLAPSVSEEKWGWLLAFDLEYPKSNGITLSGHPANIHLALFAAEAIARRLEWTGHVVTVGEIQ